MRSLLTRDNFTCMLCGGMVDPFLPREDPMAGSIDHVIPSSFGGTHQLTNLQLAHKRCNNVRGNQPIKPSDARHAALSSLRRGLDLIGEGIRGLREAPPFLPKPVPVDLVEPHEYSDYYESRFSSLEESW